MIEVEIKAQVDNVAEINDKVLKEGRMKFKEHLTIRDVYFDNIDGSLEKNGTLLRLRTTNKPFEDYEHELIYKGTKIGDGKSREEISVKVDGNTSGLLYALGYFDVVTVEKERIVYSFNNVEVCLDRVKGLGDFIEAEICVEKADVSCVKNIENSLAKVISDIGFPYTIINQSYFELLKEKNQ